MVNPGATTTSESGRKTLYMPGVAALEQVTRENLGKTLIGEQQNPFLFILQQLQMICYLISPVFRLQIEAIIISVESFEAHLQWDILSVISVFSDLGFVNGQQIYVTDKTSPTGFTFNIHFQ